MGIEIYSRESQGVIILEVDGNIDIDASELVETVGWYLNNGRKDLLCDFKRVNMIDYAGLSVLTIAYKNVVNHKGRMKFVNVPTAVMRMFEAVLLDRVFEIYQQEEVALNAFKEETVIDEIKHMKLRRRFTRLPLEMPVSYRAMYGQVKPEKGTLFDLSATGAFIFGKKVFSLHDTLFLQMRLPHIGQIEVEAKIVWLADRIVQPQQYPGMGVEFFNLDSETQKKIADFVEKNISHRSAESKPPI